MFRIQSIEIENTRSIGMSPLVIKNLKNLNIFIGKNNSGKTSVLEAIRRFFSANPQIDLPIFTKSDGTAIRPAIIRMALKINQEVVSADGSLSDEDRDIINKFGVVWFERNLEDATPPRFISFDLNKNPINLDNLAEIQTKLQNPPISSFLTNKIQEYLSRVQNERRIGVLFSDLERRIIDSADESGQTIVQKWSLGKQNPSIKANIEKFQDEFPTLYKSFARFEFYTNNPPGSVSSNDLFSEIGDGSNGITTLPFKNEGLGERDTAVLAWLIFNPQLDILLLDEPENSKHADLQRKIYKLLLEVCEKKQVFIFTHSPIFSQINKKSSIYLLNKGDRDSETKVTPVLSIDEFKYVRSELGLENSDLFFSRAVLFVEGETEEKTLVQIFEAMGFNLLEMGIRIINVHGGANFDTQKLKELLRFIRDLEIRPQIFADNDKGMKKIKTDLVKEFKEILGNKQFTIWEKEFEDNFSDQELYDSLSNLLDKYNKKIDIDINKFSATRKKRYKDKKRIVEYLKQIFNRITNLTLPKAEFGESLGQVVAARILKNGIEKDNYVDKSIKKFVDNISS